MPLFTAKDLADFLQYPVEDATAAIDERVVSGWLAEEGLTYTGSDTVPDQVFSWALELGAIVHENPTSSTTDQTAGQSLESTVRPLNQPGFNNSTPAWVDSDWLYITSDRDSTNLINWEIYLLKTDGSDETVRLTENVGIADRFPTWTP